MKKKFLLSGSLIVFGMLLTTVFSVGAFAEESVLPLSGPMTRATVVKQEFTLSSGAGRTIYINTTNKTKFASKILFKIAATNPNNDYFGLKHFVKGNDELLFNNSATNVYKYFPSAEAALTDNKSEQFYIQNYSVVPMKFTIGYTTGIHMKSNPCIDYSDIEFDL
jgi:hypothetical protein